MVLNQAEQLGALQATLAQLQADYAALRLKFEKGQPPPTTSGNSSQLPSRDQKADKPESGAKRNMVPPPDMPSMSVSLSPIPIMSSSSKRGAVRVAPPTCRAKRVHWSL